VREALDRLKEGRLKESLHLLRSLLRQDPDHQRAQAAVQEVRRAWLARAPAPAPPAVAGPPSPARPVPSPAPASPTAPAPSEAVRSPLVPAPSPPAAAGPLAAVDPDVRAAVETTLAGYARALESQDAELLARVRPDLRGAERERLLARFRGAINVATDLRVLDVIPGKGVVVVPVL